MCGIARGTRSPDDSGSGVVAQPVLLEASEELEAGDPQESGRLGAGAAGLVEGVADHLDLDRGEGVHPGDEVDGDAGARGRGAMEA